MIGCFRNGRIIDWLGCLPLMRSRKSSHSLGHQSGCVLERNVVWEPPVIYNSMCRIDTKWFPYDEQFCDMKFGSWTYGGFELDMVHKFILDVVEHISYDNGTEWRVELGVDISEYQESVEFDLLSVVGTRHIEIVPPTSIVTPLIGKYLVFTMFMVTMSVLLKLPTLDAIKALDNHFKQCAHNEEGDSEEHFEPEAGNNIEEQDLFSQRKQVHNLSFELRKRIQQVGSNIRYMERTLRKSSMTKMYVS
uniref:Neurotransmitter-gated ion-channel ligand-binding domain-containing protein n=1 Tax=Ditylenchus dipsaci TaxID=166011 RepID=A0A915DFB3_9BILA